MSRGKVILIAVWEVVRPRKVSFQCLRDLFGIIPPGTHKSRASICQGRYPRSAWSKRGETRAASLSQIGTAHDSTSCNRQAVAFALQLEHGPAGSSPTRTVSCSRISNAAAATVQTARSLLGMGARSSVICPPRPRKRSARGKARQCARLALSRPPRRVTAGVHVNGDHGAGRFDIHSAAAHFGRRLSSASI